MVVTPRNKSLTKRAQKQLILFYLQKKKSNVMIFNTFHNKDVDTLLSMDKGIHKPEAIG